MGTNKAKIDKKIKSILEGKTFDEAKINIPQVTNTMKNKFIAEEISEKSYTGIITIVSRSLSKLYCSDAEEYKEEIVNDNFKREEWINQVMDIVENSNDIEMSDILTKSLHHSLADTIMNEKDESYFVEKLLYKIVYFVLSNKIQGAIERLEDGIPISKIRDEIIEPLANKIFEKDVRENVSKLIEGEITLAVITTQIEEKLKNFGGF